jgi:hypothetical protein
MARRIFLFLSLLTTIQCPNDSPPPEPPPPAPRTDYINCQGEQERALKSAKDDVRTRIQSSLSINAELKDCILNALSSVDIECCDFYCNTHPNDLGGATGGNFNNSEGCLAAICCMTFDHLENGYSSLAATVLHEMTHCCGRDEKTAEACENLIYSGIGATINPAETGGFCQ